MVGNRLSIKEKIGYGMGDTRCDIIFGTIMLFVNYFYINIFGLVPTLIGVLLLLVRVIDAVIDPIMGALADRARSKYGRFRPWLLWTAFLYALFNVLMFTTPEWTHDSKVVCAFVAYFLLSVTYTAINIPCCSLGIVMTIDSKERVACQSYRFVIMDIVTLLSSLTLLPMADWSGGADKTKGCQMAMIVPALIGMCMFLFCFATVCEYIHPAVQTNDELKKDLKDTWKNDQWMRILLLTPYNVCPGLIRMAATMYYVTWVMEQSTHFATPFISLGVAGAMIGNMLAEVPAGRWCKLQAFFWTDIVLAIFSRAFYSFNPHTITLIMVLYFLLNILHQIPSLLHWSLMSDADDYSEWKAGKRIIGISFSGNLFSLKVDLAVAEVVIGFLLSWYDYDAGAKAQNTSILSGVVLLFSVIPGVGYLITAGVVRLLKVDRALMRQAQNDLEKCRSNYNGLNECQELKTSKHVRKV